MRKSQNKQIRELIHKNTRHLFNYSGIYIIINNENGKCYIGSSYDIRNRIWIHFREILNGKHNNPLLRRSVEKYGIDAFSFDCLEYCDREHLQSREQFYIVQFRPEFNIAKDSKAPMRGRKHTPETLEKLRGHIPWNYKMKRSESDRKNISEGKKRMWDIRAQDPEYLKWYSNRIKENPARYWLGKKVPENVAENLRRMGKEISQKIRCINTGEVFPSQIAAAKHYKVKQGHISENLNGLRFSVRGYKFERVKDEL